MGMCTYREKREKEEEEDGQEGAWRDRQSRREVRQGRADPVRSAASLEGLRSRDKEKAMVESVQRLNVLKRQWRCKHKGKDV